MIQYNFTFYLFFHNSGEVKKIVLSHFRHRGLNKIANIFRCIFWKENYCVLIQISLYFFLQGPINNESVLVDVIDQATSHCLNTLRPRQNGRHLPDDIFKWIFLNENVWISIKISLKIVPKGPVNDIPALVQTMAWSRPGDKPLSEPMRVVYRRIYASLALNELTNGNPFHWFLCITRLHWVKKPQMLYYFKWYWYISQWKKCP